MTEKWEVMSGNLVVENKYGSVLICRVNQNIVGWENNLRVIKVAPQLRDLLQELTTRPEFNPESQFGMQVLKILDESKSINEADGIH